MDWPTDAGPGWTLFLDRDGVINERLIDAYITCWEEFQFRTGVLEAIAYHTNVFDRILIVTNQQGIGKGLMTEANLADIHQRMLAAIRSAGGRIDRIYHCPMLCSAPNNCRKPAPFMALQAQRDFPDINFQRSVMVGDALTDMEFGKSVGMHTIWVSEEEIPASHAALIDGQIPALT